MDSFCILAELFLIELTTELLIDLDGRYTAKTAVDVDNDELSGRRDRSIETMVSKG